MNGTKIYVNLYAITLIEKKKYVALTAAWILALRRVSLLYFERELPWGNGGVEDFSNPIINFCLQAARVATV